MKNYWLTAIVYIFKIIFLKYSCSQYVFKSSQATTFTIHPLKSTFMNYDKPITI